MNDFHDHKKNIRTILHEFQDLIDKLRRMEENILSQEETLYVISEFAYDWEYWQGVDGAYRYVSPSCLTLTGYSPDEFYTNPHLLQEIISPDDWPKWQEHHHTSHNETEVTPIEFEIKTKQGKTKWIHHVCRPVINKKGVNLGTRGSNRDITDLKKLQQRLLHVAGHDNLTGLANRSLLLEHLNQRIKEAKRYKSQFAVAFIDLDAFKEINDSFGHDAGDHVLRIVADELQKHLRKEDILARFGGDEFVGLFTIRSPVDSTILKEKILRQIASKIHCRKFQITIGLSIGISVYPTDGTTTDDLLNKADKEMYAMKARNKAKVNR